MDVASRDAHRVDLIDDPLADDEPRPEVVEAVVARHQSRQEVAVQEEPDAALDDDRVADLVRALARHLDAGAADDLHQAVSSRIQSRYGTEPPTMGMAMISGRS